MTEPEREKKRSFCAVVVRREGRRARTPTKYDVREKEKVKKESKQQSRGQAGGVSKQCCWNKCQLRQTSEPESLKREGAKTDARKANYAQVKEQKKL